jgi:hypothetical protein
MNLEQLQEETIQKIKSGKLTYRVNVDKQNVSIVKKKGENDIEIEKAVFHNLSFLIGTLSALKRELPNRPIARPTNNIARDAVRKMITTTERKMYTRLTPEEIEKYGVNNVLPEIEKAFVEYERTNKPKYIGFSSYGDNKKLRDRVYDFILKKHGYKKVFEENGWIFYSKEDVGVIYTVSSEDVDKTSLSSKIKGLIKNR